MSVTIMDKPKRAQGAEEIQRETHGIPEAARIVGVSRNHMYQAVARGEVPSIRIGHRRVIPKAIIRKMLAEGN
jgi:excisionase family DNA binding protein